MQISACPKITMNLRFRIWFRVPHVRKFNFLKCINSNISNITAGPKVGIAMPRGSEENGTIKSPEPSDAASSSSSNSLLCDFTRVQAESFIKENGSKDGDYLFRVSRGAVVLSVCDGKNIHHLVVEDKGAAMEAKRFDERRFKRFVKHYTKTVTGLPTQLQRNIASLRS